MEYYLAIKRKGILPPATTCMNLEDVILLSEISQSQKDTFCYNSTHTSHIEWAKSQRQRVGWWSPGARGREMGN